MPLNKIYVKGCPSLFPSGVDYERAGESVSSHVTKVGHTSADAILQIFIPTRPDIFSRRRSRCRGIAEWRWTIIFPRRDIFRASFFFFPYGTFVSCPSSALTRLLVFRHSVYTLECLLDIARRLNNYDNYTACRVAEENLTETSDSARYLHNYTGARESRIIVSLIERHREGAVDKCQSSAPMAMKYVVVWR